MLLTILDLNKLTVDDVMVPRHDIVGIDIDLPWETISAELNKVRQDWVPFYKEQVNQITGVFYMQDSLRMLLEKQVLTKEVLLAHLKEPYFVPEGTALNVQLSYFQQAPENKVAFVVDEYGEIQGLLTLDDILEEIVGDFSSTLDGAKQAFTAMDDGGYLVDGAAMLREFNRKTGWDLPLSGPRTLNGLIVEHLEMLPRSGVCVLIHDYPIELLAVKDNRVKTAKILPRLKKHANE
jgi:Mg2+/Co2+ transporter CorB